MTLFDLKIYRTINNPSSYMEENTKDYPTMLSLRLPLSLYQKIEAVQKDLGLSLKQIKKGAVSEATRLLILEGLDFVSLKKLLISEPEKLEGVKEDIKKMILGDNKEPIFETMDLSELDGLIAMASMVRSRKANQLLIDA